MITTNALELCICQRCPRLFRYYYEGYRKAAYEGVPRRETNYGSIFHSRIASLFCRSMENLRPDKLRDVLGSDPQWLQTCLSDYVSRQCFEPFLKVSSSHFSAAEIISLAAGAERWIQCMSSFLSDVPSLNDPSPEQLSGLFSLSSPLEAEATLADGTPMVITSEYDCVLYNPQMKRAEIYEFEGDQNADMNGEPLQATVYAWVIYRRTGVVPSVKVICFDDDRILYMDPESMKRRFDLLPALFEMVKKVKQKETLRRASEKMCAQCSFRKDCLTGSSDRKGWFARLFSR